MRAYAKIGLVTGGYVGAAMVSSAVVAIYVACTSGPDRIASGGMYAFGDTLLFLAVLAVTAIPATCAALWFLRRRRGFWLALSIAAPIVAATGIAALLCYVAGRSATAGSVLHAWGAFSVLRLLIAPGLALGCFLAAAFAPHLSFRLALIAATLVEAGTFGGVALIWFLSVHD